MERPARARAQVHRARVLCFAWARAAAGARRSHARRDLRLGAAAHLLLAAAPTHRQRAQDLLSPFASDAARMVPLVSLLFRPLRALRAPVPARPAAELRSAPELVRRLSRIFTVCSPLLVQNLFEVARSEPVTTRSYDPRTSPNSRGRLCQKRCSPSRNQARRRTSVRARGWVAGRFACRLPPRCPRGRGARAWHPAPRRACERVRAGARARRRRRRRGSPSRCMLCARARPRPRPRGGGAAWKGGSACARECARAAAP